MIAITKQNALVDGVVETAHATALTDTRTCLLSDSLESPPSCIDVLGVSPTTGLMRLLLFFRVKSFSIKSIE